MKEVYPLNPNLISNDIKDSEYAQGVIPNRYLKGILTEISSILKNPVTVIEFLPDNVDALFRTDGIKWNRYLSPICEDFRNCTSEQSCYDLDSLHASLFRELSEINLEKQLKSKIIATNYFKKFKDTYNVESDLTLQTLNVENQSRCYLTYSCPFINFTELLFAIFFEKKIVGVLFVGQIILGKRKPLVLKKLSELEITHPCCHEKIKLLKNLLDEEISNTSDNSDSDRLSAKIEPNFSSTSRMVSEKSVLMRDFQIQQYATYLENNNYDDYIKNIFDQINKIERRLSKEMEILRSTFITKRFDELLKTFRIKLSSQRFEGNKGFE